MSQSGFNHGHSKCRLLVDSILHWVTIFQFSKYVSQRFKDSFKCTSLMYQYLNESLKLFFIKKKFEIVRSWPIHHWKVEREALRNYDTSTEIYPFKKL